MSEAQAIADVLHENVQRLSFYINEATTNSNLPPERTDEMLANEREFVQALVQAIDLITKTDTLPQKASQKVVNNV